MSDEHNSDYPCNIFENPLTGYMCISAFETAGSAKHHSLPTIFPTIEALKNVRVCADDCGIMEVHISGGKVVQKPPYGEWADRDENGFVKEDPNAVYKAVD